VLQAEPNARGSDCATTLVQARMPASGVRVAEVRGLVIPTVRLRSRSRETNPRIKIGIRQVHHEIEDHKQNREQNHRRLD
jgi:hypothetical protein